MFECFRELKHNLNDFNYFFNLKKTNNGFWLEPAARNHWRTLRVLLNKTSNTYCESVTASDDTTIPQTHIPSHLMFTPQRTLITWPLLFLFSLISFIIVQLCLVPLLLCVLQISYSSPALPTVSDPWNGFLGNPTGFLLEGCSLGEPIFDKEGFYTPLSLIFPSQRLACVCVCWRSTDSHLDTENDRRETSSLLFFNLLSLSHTPATTVSKVDGLT